MEHYGVKSLCLWQAIQNWIQVVQRYWVNNVAPSHRNLDFVNPENPDDGVELVLVLRRRLMSAILTIYLPTVLILTIVYATNFFKDFFFEASFEKMS